MIKYEIFIYMSNY